MTIFRYKEDQVPIFIIFSFFVIDLIYYFNVDNITYLICWCVLGIVVKGITAAWNHNHQHCNTFKQPILNRLLEIIYGLHTGVCGYTWVLHHNIGHHVNYLDQTKDESRWMKPNGEKMIRLRYSLEVFFTSYLRSFQVGLKHPRILKKFLWMVGITGAILVALTYHRPIPALIIIWIPMVISLLLTADSTYAHHSGLALDNHLVACRNTTINSKCFNLLTGNFGYHTAHHLKCGLHWSKLPQLHEKIKSQIPAECYVRPSLFFVVLEFIFGKVVSIFSKNGTRVPG